MEKVFYTSVWDGGVDVVTICQYDKETGEVSDVKLVDVEGMDLEILDREFITLPDLTDIEVLNFDTFKEKWIEQECNSKNFTEEIEETMDFDDMFKVIGLWSQTPVNERVKLFLERNNSCYLKY